MSSTTNDLARPYWNWAVVTCLVLTWNAPFYLPRKFSPHIPDLHHPIGFALVAVLAYLLLRGDRRSRIDWLFFLPFICIAVHLAKIIISVALASWVLPGYTKPIIIHLNLLAHFYPSLFLLLSYFVTIGLCVAVKAGVTRWRGGQSAQSGVEG